MTDLAVSAKGITKRYGTLVAVDDCAFSLERGEVHALVGSNGCGKSTLCKVISGALAFDDGVLSYFGEPANFKGPLEARRRGMATVYQELSLIPTLSVAENILLGNEPQRSGVTDKAEGKRRVQSLINEVGTLAAQLNPKTLVGHLTIDQQQVVEILKALYLEPKVILFDESTSSLDKSQVEAFFKLLADLKKRRVSVIFISHRMEEIFAVSDRVTVMRNGKYIATRATAQTDRSDLVELMVGGKRDAAVRAHKSAAGAPVLTCEALTTPILRNVSFAVRTGEVLGLGGLHGQGQSDLLLTLFGAGKRSGGRIVSNGEACHIATPYDALRSGIAYVSGDRGRTGSLHGRPILENLALADLSRGKRFALSRKDLAARFGALVADLQLKFGHLRDAIGTLSGGNQQKVILGRALGANPRILLLDDPTKGIDVHAKEDLYKLVRTLCARGMAVILYSSEDTELLENADRVLVLNGGAVIDELAGDRLTEFDLYSAALKSAA